MDSSQAWSKPEVIVLGRSAPEESVLHGCKSFRGANGHKDCSYKKHGILCQNLVNAKS
jgi:hypothetical protein